ncbi:MAG: hypothetical protein ABSD28_02905 [Tepidisphaeraceae bacterium]
MADETGQVDLAAAMQFDGSRIDALHPPVQVDAPALAAGDGVTKRQTIVAGDSHQNQAAAVAGHVGRR